MYLAFRFTFIFLIVIAFNIPSYSQDELNPCLNAASFHIVILGSSTAAGSGPSSSDSAWVNRYRNFLQTINPANQVTNLAIGGTNTYKIMPTWFVPPPGRPLTNPNNNITQAILLSADAVIVNMPSNDAASGFTANEQMFNFHTIVNTADSFNIPVWICTTQPRNFGATQIQVQLDVRDSVLSAFGTMAVDFWTNLADTNNLPNPLYDSGDGVHLNDAGHAIMVSRVKDKNILSQLFVPNAYPDFSILDIKTSSNSVCGDSLTKFDAIITNVGADSTLNLPIEISITNLDSGTIQLFSDTIPNGLLSCNIDTITKWVNTFEGGTFEFKVYLVSNDSNAINDTLMLTKDFSGFPGISVLGDTICSGDSALLSASISQGDTVLWYATPNSSNALAGGQQFISPQLNANTTYYVESVRGNLFFQQSILTRTETNISFNGYMFDLITQSDLVIDSLEVKFSTTGSQIIEVYTKQGSHLGFELDTNAWTLLLTDTIMVDSIGHFVAVNMNALNLPANDSSAYYIQLQTASANLSYQTLGNSVSRSTNELTLNTGSGISHNFANSFYPRDLAFEIHYHHGFNPAGDCSSGRLPVEAIVFSPVPNLGNDTAFCQQYYDITLDPGNFFAYSWSTGESTSSITIPSLYYPIGPNLFHVTVFDSIGCSARDSIIINYLLCSGLQEFDSDDVNVFPNPSTGVINLELQSNLELFDWATILDHRGRILLEKDIDKNYIDLRELPSGNYILLLSGKSYFSQKKITIVH